MIQIGLAAFLVFLFFKFTDKDKIIDGFISLTFVLAPAILVFLIQIGLRALDAQPVLMYLPDLLYFFIPFFMLKAVTEYSWVKSAVQAGVVFVIVLICQLLIAVLLAQL
ncbi:hypothetical protein [Agaribacter marinus]|uniref:Uncharacterized protein n=1 Tax=Agaribacter marinus TaxID=1431249 RepID=A0AA37T018_9ALTE|nr:hypothetical protein [Agaribacter marinus]GLR71789.1 hypothetical protein GCM10007852_26970 [Agaribacter marinus]